MTREWMIFHCDHDDCWIVSVRGLTPYPDDILLGVAEGPDKPTAMAVLDAMRERDKRKSIAPAPSGDLDNQPPRI